MNATSTGEYAGLRILTLHAHPDDESSKGAGSIARYRAGGAGTVLVCATGGEEGDILNPAMDRDEVRNNMAEVRHGELAEAARIIGYETVEMLGYRDSGMEDSDANKNPECFWQAPIDEAIDRFVGLLRQHRPHVLVTYSDDQQGYRHPDHLRVHDISLPAIERAGDASYRPELGEPWQVLKVYYSTWSRARMEAMHAKFAELGLESPFTKEWFDRPSQDHRISAKVDIGDYFHIRGEALRAHATQVDPASPFWFGLPDDAGREAYPYDDYILGQSVMPVAESEADLFEGVREYLAASPAPEPAEAER